MLADGNRLAWAAGWFDVSVGDGEAGGSPATDPALPGSLRVPILQRLEYWGFRLVASIFRAMPLDTASAVSGAIWRRIAPLLRRHARAHRNLAACLPELSQGEREAILLAMWEVLGRTFAEAFQLDRIAADPSRVEVVLTDEVRALITAPRGCVMASLHMGNWEVACIAALRTGVKPAGVYQRVKNPLVDAYVTGMRKAFYPAGLFSKGHDTVLRLMRIVRAGGTLAIMADLRDMRGVRVPFFGRPAPSTPFPALLARNHGVPLVAARVRRIDGVRFQVDAERVPVSRTANRDADVEQTTAALQAVFERWIREDPGQWMWAHRRWG